MTSYARQRRRDTDSGGVSQTDTLYIVVPCFNEEEVLPVTSAALLQKLEKLCAQGAISPESRILFVDDGSRDATWSIISDLFARDERFAGLKLSRNRGHQNALLAGLTYAAPLCDMAISLDADLQDDPDAIDAMVAKHSAGADVVYGVRSSRATDTAFKRGTAGMFYRLMNKMGAETVENHADYRLMSRRALEALLEFGETNLFLRGIVPLVGFKSDVVTYERHERAAGKSKYPLKKMINFAIDGVTSFSVKPLRFIFWAGCALAACSLLALVVLAVLTIWNIHAEALIVVMLALFFLGGAQLAALGVVGEYIGKIYSETKRRPRFIIEEFLKR